MKKLLFTLIGGCMIAALLTTAYADTSRLGSKNISFNPLRVVAKTAAYTVTTSDGEVDVTCSSANITITLPAISSLTGRYAFKIKKSDATVYSVIVTPGTGDTIGGESTRYLTKQNDYVVISSGPGSDWTVDFESPLVAEDYEAGTVTVPSITVNNGVTASGAVSGTSGTFTGTVTGTGVGGAVFGATTTVTVKGGDVIFEGDTADAYELTLNPADPAADVTVTLPAATSAVVVSTLTTNAPDAANSVTGVSNGLIFEGATANAFETTISPTDPTADRSIVLPNGAGTVVLGNQAATQTFTVMTTTINGIQRNILYY